MFQLNKKNIVFLSFFTIICIAITALAIFVTNNIEILPTTFNIKSDGLGIKSLEDRYSIQPLEIISKEEIIEDLPVQINYFEIDGLKNKSIQDKINKEIKNVAFSKYNQDELDENNVRNLYIYVGCMGNFANVLSVVIYKNVTNYDGEFFDDAAIGLNFDLNTGKKLEFKDLFTNDANLKSIISTSAYMTFAREYLDYYPDDYEEEYWDGDMTKIDYSNIEDKVLKVMQNFDKTVNYPFYFDEKNIFVNINGEEIRIEMYNFYNQIAIYNRYLTKDNIFNSLSETELYVFMKHEMDYVPYRRVEKINDNLFVDLQIFSWLGSDVNANLDLEKYKKEMNKQVLLAEEYLANHKDEAIVLAFEKMIIIDVYTDDMAEENFITTATMSKDYFAKTFFPSILNWEQTSTLWDSSLAFNLYYTHQDNPNINIKIDFPEGYY